MLMLTIILSIYTIFQEGDIFCSIASLPYTMIQKYGNKRTVIYTYIQTCMALLDIVSDTVKVYMYQSLLSSGTFVAYIVQMGI